jgi:hypothetical protein
MTVKIKGDVYRRVAQHLLYNFGVSSTAGHQCREGVPEIMEAERVGETGAFEQWLEGALVDVMTVQGCAHRGAEHQPLILPKPCEPHPLFQLTLTVMPESSSSLQGQPNAASSVVLWRSEGWPTFGAGERPVYGKRSGIQVYVLPAKSEQFALP